MPALRERLIENYAEHYARINHQIDPQLINAALFRHLDANIGPLVRGLPAGSRVMDLGCGTGRMLAWMSHQGNLVPCGVDSSSSQVAVARRALPHLEIECGDGLEYLRSQRGCFAAIFCTDVLEHIPGKDLLLEWVEAARDALRPSGFFYCRMPNAANLIGSFCRYRDLTHETSFTSTSIVQLLEAAGLQSCRVVPIRGCDFSSRARLRIERGVHRMLFRLCGEAGETVFTTNICAMGYRSEA